MMYLVELLRVRYGVVHDAQRGHVVHQLEVGSPEEVVARVVVSRVAVDKLELEARLPEGIVTTAGEDPERSLGPYVIWRGICHPNPSASRHLCLSLTFGFLADLRAGRPSQSEGGKTGLRQ